jgi:predicted nucleic acid-binding protein
VTAAVYLDSSAIVKLVFNEPETPGLERFLREWPRRISTAVASIETMRAARLVGDSDVVGHAIRVLAAIHLIDLDHTIVKTACEVDPPALRSLDAIHLATALSLGADLAGMVVYDRRLAAAARAADLTVWAPS